MWNGTPALLVRQLSPEMQDLTQTTSSSRNKVEWVQTDHHSTSPNSASLSPTAPWEGLGRRPKSHLPTFLYQCLPPPCWDSQEAHTPPLASGPGFPPSGQSLPKPRRNRFNKQLWGETALSPTLGQDGSSNYPSVSQSPACKSWLIQPCNSPLKEGRCQVLRIPLIPNMVERGFNKFEPGFAPSLGDLGQTSLSLSLSVYKPCRNGRTVWIRWSATQIAAIIAVKALRKERQDRWEVIG